MIPIPDDFPMEVERRGAEEVLTTENGVRVTYVDGVFDGVSLKSNWDDSLSADGLALEIRGTLSAVNLARMLAAVRIPDLSAVAPTTASLVVDESPNPLHEVGERFGSEAVAQMERGWQRIKRVLEAATAGELTAPETTVSPEDEVPEPRTVEALSTNGQSLSDLRINEEWARRASIQTLSDELTEQISLGLANPVSEPDGALPEDFVTGRALIADAVRSLGLEPAGGDR